MKFMIELVGPERVECLKKILRDCEKRILFGGLRNITVLEL